VRRDLVKIEGISDIATDVKSRTCTFRLNNDDIDLKSKLDEFAASNEHIAGWSMAM
jgi:hypothetical protein